MIVWRIANERFADLSGIGGLHVSGRWHSKGRPVCYFAEHPALAMLEVRVHMDLKETFLTNFVMMKVELASDISMMEIDERPAEESISQQLGDAWLAQSKTAVCRVRSVLYPDCYNFLFNPMHPGSAKAKILETTPVSFDERLFS